jgi:hypothetical protein
VKIAVTLSEFEAHANATALRLTPIFKDLAASTSKRDAAGMSSAADAIVLITGAELDWLNSIQTPPDCWYRGWSYYHQAITLYDSVAGNTKEYLRTNETGWLDVAVDSLSTARTSLLQAQGFMKDGDASCPH